MKAEVVRLHIGLGIREKTIISILLFSAVFSYILLRGSFVTQENLMVDLDGISKSPTMEHLFGTDWVGRDMLLRTMKGLSISIKIGLLSCSISTLLAAVLGIIMPLIGGKADEAVNWLVDFFLSVPHTLVIILISIACGGGLKGIVVGVAATHWTSLTRIIRAEVLRLREMEYIKLSSKLGHSKWYIAKEHILPQMIPQLIVGAILLFPHAILHEAGVTFLGFGLPAHEPAIGIILAESMKYLTSGKWWLAFFPGISLVLVSILVSSIGKNIEKMLCPSTARH